MIIDDIVRVMEKDIRGLLTFIERAERLKVELRHSWTSDKDRQESVADHSWMLTMMAMVIPDMAGMKIDQAKLIKMLIVHDLAEAVIGDIPAFEKSERKDNKYRLEKEAMEGLVESLPTDVAQEMLDIWEEMEQKKTPEAQMAQAIDKLEVIIQHSISDKDTWDQNDYDCGVFYKDDYYNFHPFMRALKDQVSKDLWEQLKEAGTTDQLPPSHVKRAQREFG